MKGENTHTLKEEKNIYILNLQSQIKLFVSKVNTRIYKNGSMILYDLVPVSKSCKLYEMVLRSC